MNVPTHVNIYLHVYIDIPFIITCNIHICPLPMNTQTYYLHVTQLFDNNVWLVTYIYIHVFVKERNTASQRTYMCLV